MMRILDGNSLFDDRFYLMAASRLFPFEPHHLVSYVHPICQGIVRFDSSDPSLNRQVAY